MQNKLTRSMYMTFLIFFSACGKSGLNQPLSALPSSPTHAQNKPLPEGKSLDNTTQGDQVKNPSLDTSNSMQEANPISRSLTGDSTPLMKGAKQLTAAIAICVGENRLTIQDSMVVSTDKKPSENANAFLTMPDARAGKSVIETGMSFFDGEKIQLATSVRSANLNFSYLLALRNVANVVGANCLSSAATSNSMCQCGTPEDAQKMLQRCLPNLNEKTIETFGATFAQACKANQRAAISSLIGSAQFARFN